MRYPMRVCSNQEIRKLDAEAMEKHQLLPEVLMENAGRGAADILLQRVPDAGLMSEVVVLAGKGNNAGDAFVVARRLAGLSRKVRVFCMVREEEYQGPTRRNYEILKSMGIRMVHPGTQSDLKAYFESLAIPPVVVDGLLGTGIHGDLQGIFYDAVNLVNRHARVVFSLDIPSGVCGDTGRIFGVAVRADCMAPLMVRLPDETMATVIRLDGPEFETVKEKASQYSSVVVGPGLGRSAAGKELLELLLVHYGGPVVLDADALNLVAEHQLHEFIQRRRGKTILTPHPGEMSRLLGISKEEVISKPIQAVRDAVARTHAVVVLKGACTLIGSPDDVIALNHYPNDGMATAGSGDVLAGMIGGLVGQNPNTGMDPLQATHLAVYLHSLAGDRAAQLLGHRSMTAPDIIRSIAYAFKELKAAGKVAAPEEALAWLR